MSLYVEGGCVYTCIVLPVVPSRPSRPLGVGVIGGLDRRRHLMGGIAEFWLCDGCVMGV